MGLSFVSHLTKLFRITSVSDGEKTEYELENIIDWVVAREGNEVREQYNGPAKTGEASYTQIELVLDGRYSDTGLRTLQALDDFFEWARIPEVLRYILRTRTAIGNTKKYFADSPKKEIAVHIRIDGGELRNVEFGFLSPYETAFSSMSRYLVDASVDRRVPYKDLFTDSTKRDSDKVFRCLRHDFKGLEVGTYTVTKFDVAVLVCGETGITQMEKESQLDSVPRDLLKSLQSSTGVYLSIDGMPTGIKLKQWTDGFNKRFFCLVDVDMETNSELDKGRKGISEHTKNLITSKIDELLGEKIVRGQYSLRHMAHRMRDVRTRGAGGIDVAEHVRHWDDEDTCISDMVLDKAPLDENGVIALFCQLIGATKLKGYKFRYISQDATFDFAFEYRVDEARLDVNDSYSVSRGYIDDLPYTLEEKDWYLVGSLGLDYHVGEFKIVVEDIVGNENQPIDKLDLLVAWDFDENKVIRKGGSISAATADQRSFEGVTHVLRDAVSGECQVVCLRALLNEMRLLVDTE